MRSKVDYAIDTLLETSWHNPEYYVTWSGPDQVPSFIAISKESAEDAAKVLVDNTTFLTQSHPLDGVKTKREVEDFIDEIGEMGATGREVKLIHAPSVDVEFTTF